MKQEVKHRKKDSFYMNAEYYYIKNSYKERREGECA